MSGEVRDWEVVLDRIAELDAEIMLLEPRDQFDPCLVGVVERFGGAFALYSKAKVIAELAAELEGDDDPEVDPETSALEHYEFNIVGGWVGSGTPGFLIDTED